MSSKLRWLLFVPGAVVAAATVTVLVELFDRLFPWNAAGWVAYAVLVPLGWALITLTFILVGVRIAPAAQRLVALVLALCPVGVVLLDIVATAAGYKSTLTPKAESNLSDVGMIVGLAVGVLVVFRAAKETGPRRSP